MIQGDRGVFSLLRIVKIECLILFLRGVIATLGFFIESKNINLSLRYRIFKIGKFIHQKMLNAYIIKSQFPKNFKARNISPPTFSDIDGL